MGRFKKKVYTKRSSSSSSLRNKTLYSKKFYFSKKWKCFVVDGKQYQGVHRQIHSRFLPSPLSSLPLQQKNKKKGDVVIAKKAKGFGMKFGTRIHNEIKFYIDKAYLATNAHVRSRMVIEYITKMGLRFEGGEVPVWWKESGISTKIDVVCKNPTTNNYVLIELKTGTKHKLFEGTQYMKHPFTDILFTLMNVACIQLFISTLLWNRTHGKNRLVERAFVIHVSDESVIHFDIPTSILKHRKVLSLLLQTKNKVSFN
jgi:hypothetical protein